MTAMLNQSSQTVRRLIDSCQETQQHFRNAANAVRDTVLKRLFALYAQQRTRFAEELRDYSTEEPGPSPTGIKIAWDGFATDADLLDRCLANEKRALELY